MIGSSSRIRTCLEVLGCTLGAGPSQWKRIPGQGAASLGVISDACIEELGCGSWTSRHFTGRIEGPSPTSGVRLAGPLLQRHGPGWTGPAWRWMERLHAANAARLGFHGCFLDLARGLWDEITKTGRMPGLGLPSHKGALPLL